MPRVYPRVCGGTASALEAALHQVGLSPRVRGNHFRANALAVVRGSIPACAGEPRWLAGRARLARVYPRVCGGTRRPNTCGCPRAGLSPRVRGNPSSPQLSDCREGSIPACAGEPSAQASRSQAKWVYPRVCGGTSPIPASQSLGSGLSPRVRGNQDGLSVTKTIKGSIPACAGEPTICTGRRPTRRVYPRVCGGTSSGRADSVAWPGLSPRVRGNLAQYHRAPMSRGSIPACAGEPTGRTGREGSSRVYPRVCGGTVDRVDGSAWIAGLSPRVRGNPAELVDRGVDHGSIPACAGEPRPIRSTTTTIGVYPRVCGGTSIINGMPIHNLGLSPRVRGNRHGGVRADLRAGSIPACAGEPIALACRGRWRRVYPRVCGGTGTMRVAWRRSSGLSPRVRGNLGSSRLAHWLHGSIPACAGEPVGGRGGFARHRVYPRVCGGTPATRPILPVSAGLSPRVRGNRLEDSGVRRVAGSIPACAGEPLMA